MIADLFGRVEEERGKRRGRGRPDLAAGLQHELGHRLVRSRGRDGRVFGSGMPIAALKSAA